jgi:hypothetical protein
MSLSLNLKLTHYRCDDVLGDECGGRIEQLAAQVL